MTRRLILSIAFASASLAAPLTSPAIAQDASNQPDADQSEPETGDSFDFPRSWFYNADDDGFWAKMNHLVGKSANSLEFKVRNWQGVDPSFGSISPKALAGRIVVLNFWDTNSDLCIESIPSFNSVLSEYGERGVEVIGVCAERGSERMGEVVSSKGIDYVTGRDTFRATARNYGLLWRPWTVVIDRKGIIRAAGLRAEFVGQAIEKILQKQPATREFTPRTARVQTSDEGDAEGGADEKSAAIAGDISQEWLEVSYERYQTLKPMINKKAPELEVETWRNSFERKLRDQRGKVVLLYFWVVGDERCTRMCRILDGLYEDRKDDGLMIIGIADRASGEDMTAFLREHNINFPVCVDPFRATINRYEVDGFPDVYAIGKRGRLRAPDLKTKFIPETVDLLLSEDP